MKLVCFSVLLVLLTISCDKKTLDPTRAAGLNFVTQFSKAFGGNVENGFYAGSSTADGGFIAAGYNLIASSSLAVDGYVIKFDGNGNKQWEKLLGGSDQDYILGIKEVPGGFIGTGYTKSVDGDIILNNGGMDVMIFRLDATGNLIWLKTIGTVADELPKSMLLNSDGSLTIAGSVKVNINGVLAYNGWVCKFDQNGNILWQKNYGGSGIDVIQGITSSGDGGFVFTGSTTSNDGDLTGTQNSSSKCWVAKIDGSGNSVWHKVFGGSQANAGQTIISSGSEFIVPGVTTSNDGDVTNYHGDWDAWIIKLNASGNLVWQKTVGGTDYEWYPVATRTTDGNILLAINSKSTNGDFITNNGLIDAWVVKIDDDGNQLGKQNLGGSLNDNIYGITQGANNSYYLLGSSNSSDAGIAGVSGTALKAWLVKFLDQP